MRSVHSRRVLFCVIYVGLLIMPKRNRVEVQNFEVDLRVSEERNVTRFRDYLTDIYADSRRLCRCSHPGCGDVVPEEAPDRPFISASYKTERAARQHKKKDVLSQNTLDPSYWLIDDILRDGVPQLREIYRAARHQEGTFPLVHLASTGGPTTVLEAQLLEISCYACTSSAVQPLGEWYERVIRCSN
jgi:hypothetical protein